MKICTNQKLIHIPTGRPVEVASVDERTFTVHTLDDIWPHPKTGKPWGGCAWVLPYSSLKEFRAVEEKNAYTQMCLW